MDFSKGNKTVKVLKAGNSEAIRLAKQDVAIFKAKPGDQVVREVSSDGISIIFRKMPEAPEDIKKEVNDVLNKDADLIQASKNL